MTTEVAIHQLADEFVRLFNAKDLEALVPMFYAPDARVLAPGAPMVQGHDQIKALFSQLAGMVQSLSLETISVESSGDLAAEIGRYEMMTIDGNRDVGKAVVVYRRQSDGSWKSIADIFNSDNPPAG
jgi:uncharacterized protein (TIGR02246 family)